MAKKPLFKFLPLVFLLHSAVFAGEHIFLYVHPFTLPINPLVLRSMWFYDRPLTIYSTLEFSLNEYVSIPITPSLWVKYDDYYRFGSGFGIRCHINGGPFYFQIMPAYYVKFPSDTRENLSDIADIRFHIGVGDRVLYLTRAVFFDIGIGGSSSNKGISIDANFGYGIF